MKIAHLADIHIRNDNSRNEEYIHVFKKLYRILEDNLSKQDFIVIVGDLFHQKTELSANSVIMASHFLRKLSSITRVILMPGNHDFSRINKEKSNSMEAIYTAMQIPDMWYFHNTCMVNLDNNIVLYSHSEIDNIRFSKEDLDKNKINIATFHGVIDGSATFNGFKLESDVKRDYFKMFDCTMLGDVHRMQGPEDVKNMMYCGSLVQQDAGELYHNHGFMLWDIKGKDDISWQFRPIRNEYGIRKMEVYKAGHVIYGENGNVDPKSKIIYVLKEEINRELLDEIVKKIPCREYEIRQEYEKIQEELNIEEVNLNFYDISNQDKILRDFIKDKELAESAVILNRDINDKLKVKDTFYRNNTIDLCHLKLKGLFSYKSEQIIDFSDLKNNVVGIYGLNASGKSSIVDAFLWVLYGKFGRSTAKAEILNKETEKGYCKLEFEMGGKRYKIERTINYRRQSSLSFNVLNGDKWEIYSEVGDNKRDVDKLISKFFGSYEDMTITNISFQDSLNAVISDKKLRKDVISRFLGLNVFEECYAIANKDKVQIKNDISWLESSYKSHRVDETKAQLAGLEKDIADTTKEISDVEQEIKSLYDLKSKLAHLINHELYGKDSAPYADEFTKLQNFIYSAPAKIKELEEEYQKIEHDKINAEIDEIDEKEQKLFSKIKDVKDKLSGYLKENTNLIKNKYKEKFNKTYLELGHKEDVDRELKILIKNAEGSYKNSLFQLSEAEKRVSEFKDKAACGGVGEYASCHFIKDLVNMENTVIPRLREMSNGIKVDLENLLKKDETSEIARLKKEVLDISTQRDKEIDELEEAVSAKEKQKNVEIEAERAILNELKSGLKIKRQKADTLFSNIQSAKAEIEKSHKELEECLKALDVFAQIKMHEEDLSKIGGIKNKEMIVKSLNEHLHGVQVDYGKCVSTISAAEETGRLLSEKEQTLKIYTAYLEAYSEDGIQHHLLSKIIPSLAGKVNKILKLGGVDFAISIEIGEDKDIYINKLFDNYTIPVDFCSGMEKTMISLAFRCAYSSINFTNKLNLFMADEIFTTFDPNYTMSVNGLLQMLKHQFGTVVIISHLSNIIECYEKRITVQMTGNGSVIM